MFAIELGHKAVLPVNAPFQVIAGHAHIVFAANAWSTMTVPAGAPNGGHHVVTGGEILHLRTDFGYLPQRLVPDNQKITVRRRLAI